MLLNILDLEEATVEDIMVPRSEVVGIDLDDDWSVIREQLSRSHYTRMPVYRGDIDQVMGFVHIRRAFCLASQKPDFGPEDLEQIIRDPYFIPEGTPLNKQLLYFQQQRRRIGLVVNEYGDIMGLVTLEDILEEIVGQFTTDPSGWEKDITLQPDGSWLVDGSAHIRAVNRVLKWELPTEGPKTINGLVVEYLETIPEPGTVFLLAGHPVEIVKISGNRVKTMRIRPAGKVEETPS
jgi:Mg2+/Co2+ transporter CorB